MMLRALYDYARRKNLLEDPDFEKKRVDYLLNIDRDGRVLALVPTQDGGRAPERMVPRMPERTVKILPGFFFDNAKYVLGLGGDPKKRARNAECVAAFQALVEEAAKVTGDEGAMAVSRFFANRDREMPRVLASRAEDEWTGSENIAFTLDGDEGAVHERAAVRAHWTALRNKGEDGEVPQTLRCLVTGEMGPATRLHGKIKRLPGGQTSGTALVSFNAEAFTSHGLEQGDNAPVSRAAAEGYVTALNELLEGTPQRRHRYGVPVGGDAVTVFWTSGESPAAEYLMDLFAPPPTQDAAVVVAESPLRGIETAGLDDTMPFYAVTLSANAARVVVRDWFQSTVGQVNRNVKRYFDDLRIGRGGGPVPTWRLVKALEAPGNKDLPPDLGTRLFAAALQGRPFARELLASALRRLRLPPDKTDERRMLELRCGIIKATLLRLPRGGASSMEVSVSLDESNTSVPYLLGRLFAALERLQGAALGDINATIRDRYFGSASSTPAVVFPRLLRLSVHHAAKADKSEWLEKLKGRIIAALPAEAFPSTMGLEAQGLFAIGYYHQREKFFEAKPKDEKPDEEAAA